MRISFLIFAGASVCAACGGDSGFGWEGADPHVVVEGFLDGENVDIAYTGAEATVVGLTCKREYETPLVGGVADPSATVHVETEIQGEVEINGELRSFQLELKRHDIQDGALEAPIMIVPRNDLARPDVRGNEIWAEWEWTDANGNDLFEESAQGGTVIVHAFTGTPSPTNNVIPEGEGYIGVTVDAYWSPQERLQISLTAPCVENEVEETAL